MYLLFDQRLTDPKPAAVREALKKACVAANGRRRTGTVSVLSDGPLPGRVVREPQGVYSNRGARGAGDAARLVLAWWTAPGGRKLARVRSWREPWPTREPNPNDPVRVAERDCQNRPSVWHLDPERITGVEVAGETEWVAVCGCGAAGSPASLAWASGMCGPCRDRVEDYGPEAVTHPPSLLTEVGFSPARVAFTPDGRHVVAAGSNRFRVWDAATGRVQAGDYGTAMNWEDVVTADGRFVVLCDGDGTVSIVEAATGRRRPWGRPGRPRVVLATGRPGELVVQRWWDGGLLHRVVLDEDGRWVVGREVAPPLNDAFLHELRPDPDTPRAVFVEHGNVVVAGIGRDGDLATQHEFRLGLGQYDRTGNWHTPKLVRFTADGNRLLFVSLHLPDEHVELWNPTRSKALLQATFPARIRDARFSPDGENLFVLGEDGTVFVCHPGLITHVRARLRWHFGPAHSLAISPDGRTLATAGAEGVKLWPVGRLLELL